MHRFTILIALLVSAAAANAQLTGTYNIGGDFASYDDLTEAFDDLMTQGASGAVTFLIAPGTYVGQASLGAIQGNPANIVVRSASNNAEDVTLAFDAVFPLPNHIVELDGTANLRFEDLTFHALNTSRARILHFTGNTDNLKLWDCVFIGSQSTSTNSYFDRVMIFCDQNAIGTPDNPDGLNIIDCEFRYGYQAIEVDAEGIGGARAQGLFIAESTFADQLSVGVYINNAVGEFSQNRITTSTGNSYTGLRTSNFEGGSVIQRNVIQAHAIIDGCTGIEAGNTLNTTDNRISDNMITVSATTGEAWGLAVYNLWGTSVVYNSVAVTSGSTGSKAFYHLSNFADGQDLVLRNNIFANYSGGVALESSFAANIVTEDHNDLYTDGAALVRTGGTEYATLSAYQAGTGDGASDLNVDPAFPFLPDLHLNSCVLDNVGEYFYVPSGDIDFEARGNPISDIGVDEFTYSSAIVTAPDITVAVDDLPYTLTAANGSNYSWSNGSTAQSIAVTTAGPYTCSLIDVNGCTYSIAWTVNVDFSTGMAEGQVAGVQLYPVPVSDVLHVNGLPSGTRFDVLDTQGRIILNGTSAADTTIDVQALHPGMHLLRWVEDGSPRSARFITQ